jgi:hypothetical protein
MKSRSLLMPLAVVTLLAACKSSGSHYDTLSKADTTTIVSDTVSANSPKLVKTAEMNFRVKNVQQTDEAISALVHTENGMVMHNVEISETLRSRDIQLSSDSLRRVSAFNVSAEMIVKVPTDKLDEFMNQVSHMSTYVKSRKMDIEDRSLDYISEQMKLKNRNDFVVANQKKKVIVKDPSSVLNLKDDMVDRKIANLRTDEAVKYRAVQLSFFQLNTVAQETVANDDTSAYDLPFLKKFSLAFGNGWYAFYQFIIIITNLWAFIVAGGACWWAVWYWYKRKRVKPAAVNI